MVTIHGAHAATAPAANGTVAGQTVSMGLALARFTLGTAATLMALIAAMQEINASVRNAWFAPSFFRALAVTAVATIVVGSTRDRRAFGWTLAGLALYAAAFAITLGISVPLNDALAEEGPVDAIADLAAVRADYEGPWVRWNIARTVASTLALVALIRALMVLRRATGDR